MMIGMGPMFGAVAAPSNEAIGSHWPRIAFPDGSGSIALPPGWRINSAQQAAVELQGPNGEAVALGITFPVGPPQFTGPGVMAAPYLLPPDAYAMVSEVTANKIGQRAQVRVIEVQPVAALTANGRTAFLLADQLTQGRPYRSFALVNSADLGNGYWQFYMSLLTAPTALFAQALPQMVAVWQSWGISQGEMNRRTSEALLTMKETHRILQETAEGRRSTDWHRQLTGMTLQGRWVIEDTRTGERREVTSEQQNALIAAEPGRWRSLSALEMKR